MSNKQWESYADGTSRLKVDGGHLYVYRGLTTDIAMTFVPDIDLQRYQSHLRDAYNQGYKNGREDARYNEEITPSEKIPSRL